MKYLILILIFNLLNSAPMTEAEMRNYFSSALDIHIPNFHNNCDNSEYFLNSDSDVDNVKGLLYHSNCNTYNVLSSLNTRVAYSVSRASTGSSDNTEQFENINEMFTGFKTDTSTYDAVRGADDVPNDRKVDSMNDYRDGSGLIGLSIRNSNNIIDIKKRVDLIPIDTNELSKDDRKAKNETDYNECKAEFSSYFQNSQLKTDLTDFQLQTFHNCLNYENRMDFGFRQKQIALNQETAERNDLRTQVLDATQTNLINISSVKTVLTDLKNDVSSFIIDSTSNFNSLIALSNENNSHLQLLLTNQDSNYKNISRSLQEIKDKNNTVTASGNASVSYITNNYYYDNNSTTASTTPNNDNSTVKVDVTGLERIMQSIADFLGVGSTIEPSVPDISVSDQITNFDPKSIIQTASNENQTYFESLLRDSINNIINFDFGLGNLFDDLKGFAWQDIELRSFNNVLLISITEQSLNDALPFDFMRIFVLLLSAWFSLMYIIRNFAPR